MSIKCPTCKVENKDGAKFCKECGCSFASLIACPACSAMIKPGRFCASCGHSFATPVPQSDETPAAGTSAPKIQEQTIATPIDISFTDEAEPVQPPVQVQPIPAPVAPVPTTPMPARAYGSFSALPAEPPARKSGFKIAYALIPLAIALGLGGAYWWKSNQVETAAAPVPAAIPVPVAPEAVTPAAPVAPPPAPAPTAPVPTPEPAPAPPPAPSAEPTPVAKTAPVVPAPKPEPSKVPVTAVKSVPVEKSPVAEKPATPHPQMQKPSAAPAAASAQPAPKAEAPKPAGPAKTLDDAYNERITAECPQGFFPGMACREKVRWQMCEGKWSPDAISGQTTCKGGGTK